MSASTETVPFVRFLFGSALLLGGMLLVNACGSSEPAVQKKEQAVQTPQRLRITATDSLSGDPLGSPLDSARAINRTFDDTIRANSAGEFVIQDPEPALHVFDVSGYGYHTQKNVGVLVEPGDSTEFASTTLLPQRLTVDCSDSRPYFWESFVRKYKDDSTSVRIQLTELLAQDGEVTVRPVAVNDLSSPAFIPNNFGALGHYEVLLYDNNNNRLSYTYKDAPPDDGHRIYSKGDIRPIVQGVEQMDESVLVVEDSLEEGTTVFAKMRYTFSPDDTLEATSATTFPKLDRNLDTLRTAVYDTVRTAGEVRVPEDLVLQRDTTIVEVVGIDTTVTRRGYTLFSTLRDGNAASTPKEARNLLYVPDSVIARARRDSLEAIAEAKTTVPDVDTTDLPLSEVRSPIQIVDRTNTAGLRSILTDEELIQEFANGLPSLDMTADSLLSFSKTLRGAYLQTPTLSKKRVRRGVEADSVQADSVILSAPASDSLFRMFGSSPPDTAASDTTASDTTIADRAAPDTAARPRQTNPFLLPDLRERLAPDVDSITIDSLRLTVAPGADSVATTSVVTSTLSDPPPSSYWYASPDFSREDTPVFIADPSFFRLRARTHIDTTATLQIAGLLPDRVGIRDQTSRTPYPQQVVRIPAGTYRQEYLETWKAVQEDNLKDHYCEIFPFPMETDWKRASMY